MEDMNIPSMDGTPDTPSTKRQKQEELLCPSPFRITTSNAVVLYSENMTMSTGPPRQGPTNCGPSKSTNLYSMQELITSPTRSLLVGPERVHTTVHANLFRGISAPLHQLLNSHSYGHISDINEVLKFDDTQAFLQLIRIAYKIAAAEGAISANSLRGASVIGEVDATRSHFVPKCTHCRKAYLAIEIDCENCQHIYANGIKPYLEELFNQQLQASIRGINLDTNTRSPLETPLELEDATGKVHPLLYFAKVWALAVKYAVFGLQISAFKGFQRRLKKYAKGSWPTRDLDELLDVLKYLAAADTSSIVSDTATDRGSPLLGEMLDDDQPNRPRQGTQTLLRTLMRYVACQLDLLMQEDEFRELLAHNSTLGLELAVVVAEALRSSAAE